MHVLSSSSYELPCVSTQSQRDDDELSWQVVHETVDEEKSN